MVDHSLMYEEEHFVLLIPGEEEEILNSQELTQKLSTILSDRQASLPHDLKKLSTVPEQVKYLLNTACEFELQPGQTIQWYAVRLEK
ncbi:MAG: chlororespiratory reduction protein 7 [Cyanobacteria bacterium P01_H01_bin.58]